MVTAPVGLSYQPEKMGLQVFQQKNTRRCFCYFLMG